MPSIRRLEGLSLVLGALCLSIAYTLHQHCDCVSLGVGIYMFRSAALPFMMEVCVHCVPINGKPHPTHMGIGRGLMTGFVSKTTPHGWGWVGFLHTARASIYILSSTWSY